MDATLHQYSFGGRSGGFVAVEEAQLRCGGEVGESVGEAGELGAGRLLLHRRAEKVGFDGPTAADAPDGGGHVFDEPELDGIGGDVVLNELVDGFLEAG